MNVPSSDGNRYRIVAEINMIPFIDIALVLLIIFMVMTPFLVRQQIEVNLPRASKTDKSEEDAKSVTVQVDKGGTFFVEGQPVVPDRLIETLKRCLPRPESGSILIEADQDVPFQRVVTVLDAGKQLGVTKTGVCVKPASGSAAPAAGSGQARGGKSGSPTSRTKLR